MSRLPHLFVQIEPTLLPIMKRMLTSDGQGTSEYLVQHMVLTVRSVDCGLSYLKNYSEFYDFKEVYLNRCIDFCVFFRLKCLL